MESAAEAQNYEIAVHWRDKLEAIEHSTASQHVLLDHEINKDIIGYFNKKNYAALVIIHIREGKITNKSSFKLDLRDKVIQKTDILASFLKIYPKYKKRRSEVYQKTCQILNTNRK